MKRSVQWHKDCLANARQYVEMKRAEMDRLQGDIYRATKGNLLRESQIIEAEKRGVTEFDAEKFNIKRPKN